MEKSSYDYAELDKVPGYEESASGCHGNSIITRNLPLVNIFGKRGFFLFSSKQSYDKFKVTKFKDAKLDADGVGVPLFHLVTKHNIMAHISARKPVYVIYKYVLKELQSPPPYSQGEIVLQDDSYCLYKVPFCEIYKSRGITKATYKLIFPFESKCMEEHRIRDDKLLKKFGVSFDGNKLLWDATSEKKYTFSYNLRVVESDLSLTLLPVSEPGATIGTYDPKFYGWIPMKTYTRADLRIMEKSLPTALGIVSVPSITEVLACQGMLLHRIEEDRKERRAALESNNNSSLLPIGGFC